MRYKRNATDEQIKFIVDNPELSNQELSEKLGIPAGNIGNYKSRLRKMGVKIPKSKRASSGLKKLAEQLKKKK
jgi:biotin operon repressor